MVGFEKMIAPDELRRIVSGVSNLEKTLSELREVSPSAAFCIRLAIRELESASSELNNHGSDSIN